MLLGFLQGLRLDPRISVGAKSSVVQEVKAFYFEGIMGVPKIGDPNIAP